MFNDFILFSFLIIKERFEHEIFGRRGALLPVKLHDFKLLISDDLQY
jgi:hypothetical protein